MNETQKKRKRNLLQQCKPEMNKLKMFGKENIKFNKCLYVVRIKKKTKKNLIDKKKLFKNILGLWCVLKKNKFSFQPCM